MSKTYIVYQSGGLVMRCMHVVAWYRAGADNPKDALALVRAKYGKNLKLNTPVETKEERLQIPKGMVLLGHRKCKK
jgi:hypothetical protein